MSKEKEKLKFVFPNIMAKMMKKVDMRTQMESSMMSMFLIMIGMTLMVIYLLIYGDMGIFYKCLIIFNLLCGFVFISSFLVTTYHQYIHFMEMAEIDPAQERRDVLKRGNIVKRIRLAIKEKHQKNKESIATPKLLEDAVENMIEAKQDELEGYQKLEKEAEKLKEEHIKKEKGGIQNNEK